MIDLDKLIATVESGEWDTILSLRALPKLADGHRCSRRLATYGRDACSGSLDAALRLHEALLPGWEWGRVASTIAVFSGEGHVYSADDDTPARAWLLAILRAVKAQGGAA